MNKLSTQCSKGALPWRTQITWQSGHIWLAPDRVDGAQCQGLSQAYVLGKINLKASARTDIMSKNVPRFFVSFACVCSRLENYI